MQLLKLIKYLHTKSCRKIRGHGFFLSSNDRKLYSLKDIHSGQRCFIIGSGPSLKVKDLDRLKNEITFACNKIYLAFDNTNWRPTYYSIYDILVAENNKNEIDELTLFKIFGENTRPYFNEESAIWLRSIPLPTINGEHICKFSTNALEGLYGGWTVTYMQMQLAFYMGIREVYLLGIDFSFKIPPSTGEMCSSGEILKSQGEINHFHKDYRKKGETWTMPLLDLQRNAYKEAKNTFEMYDGKIINASRHTELDVFPVVNFDSLFG